MEDNFENRVHLATIEPYFVRLDLSTIYPPFLEMSRELLVNLYRRQEDFWAISGYRDEDEQDSLYAQGRTKPGNIVTNARFGSSAHNFGIAIDFCKDKDVARAGIQPDWNLEAYRPLAEEASELDLEAAFWWQHFKEGPHIQLPLERKGIKLSKLKALYEKGGIKAVWKFLDTIRW